MEKTFVQAEIQKFYEFFKVTETEIGFKLHPASVRQGREALLIPTTLPTAFPDYDRPIDLTIPWGDDVVEQILQAFAIEDYTELFSAYCRFGVFMAGLKTFQITKPVQASHIQLIGIRESDGAGWMMQDHHAEQQLDAISADSYKALIPQTGELIRGWILNTDFRTQPIQLECSRRLSLDKAPRL